MITQRDEKMADSTPEQRLALIKENLAEVLNEEIIKKVLDEGGHPKIYWGMFSLLICDAGAFCLGNTKGKRRINANSK